MTRVCACSLLMVVLAALANITPASANDAKIKLLIIDGAANSPHD